MSHRRHSDEIRERLLHAIEHFEHTLPGQAPIQDFVHHNTLHGYQHLPFPEALEAARRTTGAHGYLPPRRFRELFREGRIDRSDLEWSLAEEPELAADEPIFTIGERTIRRGELLITALTRPILPITGSQLNWQIEEMEALERLQGDVAEKSRRRLLANSGLAEPQAVGDLWNACLERLDLEHYLLHPEELLDLDPERAEAMLARLPIDEGAAGGPPLLHPLMRKESGQLLDALFERVGPELTLRGVLLALTGHDILNELRPALIRHLANYLDQGMAAWHGDRTEGFYAAWREAATGDPSWIFNAIHDWRDHLAALPEDPLSTVMAELHRLGLDEARWPAYLERLAQELPGWSGMFLWRQRHPGYEGLQARIEMVDYLAVRLVMERLFAQRLCRKYWQVEPSLDMIRWYFRRRRSEFFVRHTLFNDRLPEYLATLAEHQAERGATSTADYPPWKSLADRVWTWRRSPSADRGVGYTVHGDAWRLFRLAQHLGISGGELRTLDREGVRELFASIDLLTESRAGLIWLRAYERHYREPIFAALAANRGRGRWAGRNGGGGRPTAQVVFCMDEREEGIRRHLEELAPGIETLGAAAHFNVFHFWHGLDDAKPQMLCPVVAVPTHAVQERPRDGEEGPGAEHRRRRGLRLRLQGQLLERSRRGLIGTALVTAAAAPAALAVLAAKVTAPLASGRLIAALRRRFDHEGVATRIDFTAAEAVDATPAEPQPGYTDTEQADRGEAFLRNIGLLRGFAPFTVIVGHGSSSQNNPHLAAYDCGACSGRHSGPNARVLAAILNRPEVRALLAGRGIAIPDDCHFLGAEHNTCSEAIDWYDLEDLPGAAREPFAALREALAEAARHSAHERCRRLASAPREPTLARAAAHIAGRALDFSQARPELGHATNACALIGRRSVTRGAFFDRRMFLISYDPTTDDDAGSVLERLLLANGPVGAGINLEYYFSTVDNQRYGCGTKVTHNVTGLLGVMEGTSSDLRTGLPEQMIEVHEAMRLQVIVEAKVETLTAIYLRQPPLQELIGNGWLLLSAIDPDSGEISVFKPGVGFEPWRGDGAPPPTVARSADWYRGHDGPLAPALLNIPEESDA